MAFHESEILVEETAEAMTWGAVSVVVGGEVGAGRRTEALAESATVVPLKASTLKVTFEPAVKPVIVAEVAVEATVATVVVVPPVTNNTRYPLAPVTPVQVTLALVELTADAVTLVGGLSVTVPPPPDPPPPLPLVLGVMT